jgi:hypothetical protein
MIARLTADSLQRRGIDYAWVIAGVTFLAMLATSHSLSAPLSRDGRMGGGTSTPG